MEGFDDLAVVDALQVDRSDAEVAVAELALDDDQRHAFAGELDGVRVPELVRRSVDHGEQRADREPDPQLEPRAKFLPHLRFLR